MKKVKFKIYDCVVSQHRYPNGQIALMLRCAETGEPIAKATAALQITIPTDHVLIKDYAENKGILKALIEADVIEPAKKVIDWGFVEFHLCKLKPLED